MYHYVDAVRAAEALCLAVRDDPLGRRAAREAFYRRLRDADGDGFCYGDSELAFLDWEIRAGVLDPQHGSDWWRDVNLHFIFLAELADLLAQHGLPGEEAPLPTRHWLTFIADPSPRHWYRAHNASILAGFERYAAAAWQENQVGRDFLNITLYRLLFAQALVEDATPFGDMGAWVADPRGFSVELLVHLADFYPPRYPLQDSDRPLIEGHGWGPQEIAIRIMDGMICNHVLALYHEAAVWNDAPFLLAFLDGARPAYPPTLACRVQHAAGQAEEALTQGILAGQHLSVAEDGPSGLQAG